MDSQKVTLLLFKDLTSAFDSIDHSRLLETLKTRFGINGLVRVWIESYSVPCE